MASRERPQACKHDVPAAVQRWNMDWVDVLCPFCGSTHRHEVVDYRGGKFYDKRQFMASCKNLLKPQVYWLEFPFCETTGVSNYTINRRHEVFVRNGALPAAPRTDGQRPQGQVEDLVDLFAQASINGRGDGLRRFTDCVDELDVIDDQIRTPNAPAKMKVIDYVLQRSLIDEDTDPLAAFLYPACASLEKDIVLRGVDGRGSTFLSLAACCGSKRVLEILLENEAEIDAANCHGRTPLMEAALWGRLQNLQLLLDNEADASLRDIEGRRAIDLARLEDANEEERFLRSGDHYLPAREAPDAFRERRAIVALLTPLASPTHIVSGDVFPKEHYTLEQSTGTPRLVLTPKVETAVSFTFYGFHKSKTIGSMWRGSNYGWIHALSGGMRPDDEEYLGGPKSIELAFKVAEELGFKFRDFAEIDLREPGRFYASHVEVKLMAFFVDTHVVYERDDSFGRGCPARIRPPVGPPPEILIFVSREPCGECLRFRDEVAKYTKVSVVFQTRAIQ